jgi:hypothetical protein
MPPALLLLLQRIEHDFGRVRRGQLARANARPRVIPVERRCLAPGAARHARAFRTGIPQADVRPHPAAAIAPTGAIPKPAAHKTPQRPLDPPHPAP